MRAITEYIGPVFNVVDGKPKFIEIPDRIFCTNEKCKHNKINSNYDDESCKKLFLDIQKNILMKNLLFWKIMIFLI